MGLDSLGEMLPWRLGKEQTKCRAERPLKRKEGHERGRVGAREATKGRDGNYISNTCAPKRASGAGAEVKGSRGRRHSAAVVISCREWTGSAGSDTQGSERRVGEEEAAWTSMT